jgi:predicted O-linked N-acetylglucosamine transferase (SPINDLY family)
MSTAAPKSAGAQESPAATTPPGVPACAADLEEARALKHQGNLSAALALCQQILFLRPDDIDAAVVAAEVLVARGERDQAIATYTRQIELRPDRALAFYKRANLLKDAGQPEAAVADYDRALELDPTYAYAFCNRGVVLARLGRLEAALESYDRAIAIAPGDVIALFNRADVLRELERSEQALAAYGQIIAIHPDHLQSYCNRGVLLTELERYDEARADFDRALGISSNIPDLYFGRGRLLHRQQHFEEALADYQQAYTLDPNYAAAYFARGEVLGELGRSPEALASFDKALALRPDYAEAHLGRANVLTRQRRHVEAIQAYERALSIKSDSPFTPGLLQHAKMLICDWREFDTAVEWIVAGVRRGERVSNPFALLALSDEASIHYEGTRVFTEEVAPAKTDLPPLARRPTPEKLRIGYFSCDFREHPVAMLTTELFESHDRSRFEITAFSLGPEDSSPARERLKKAFDRFIDINHITDRDAAMLARQHEIDIALDLCGHTNGGRIGIFSRRASPIQATWLGYAGTTGAGYIDYLIGDPTVIPEEHRRYYSERIAYLPHCYLPNDSTRVIAERPAREQLQLPERGFVFCSFNNSYKFTPEVFSSWARILTRVEGSVLWLAHNESAAAKNLQLEAERRGIDPRRVIFAGRTATLAHHLARLQVADLFLDTLPYNAHSTALDALWAGLPVLTRLGGSFVGRVAASALRAIGLPELVTTTLRDYEELAVELATHPRRLADIKQRLAHNRLTTPLFDSRSFVRELEAVYLAMYERHARGQSPDHIHIPAQA